MSKYNGFQREVLTHLKYIREIQDRHDKTLGELFDKMEIQQNKMESKMDICDKRFDKINKRVDTAEGFAKGAMAVGGIGGAGGFISILTRWFR